jgi:hypothetical protein
VSAKRGGGRSVSRPAANLAVSLIRILVGAFDKAWEAVQASGEVFDSKARVDTARAILAKHIIAAAKDGERDEGRLSATDRSRLDRPGKMAMRNV